MHRLSIAMLCCAFTLAACSNEKPRELTLADIRFPDPEREAIVKNGITLIKAWDTAEYFSVAPHWREKYGKTLSRWADDTFVFLGTALEHRLYDSSGNRTFYWRNNSMLPMCGYGICPHEVRDSAGRLVCTWKREPTSRCDTFWYCLLKPSNKFLAIRHSFRDRDDSRDTTTYTIDDKGRLLKGTHYSGYPDDSGWHYTSFDTTWYTYVGDKLTKKQVHYSNAYEQVYSWNLTERYYYKDNLLDSMSSTKAYPSKKWQMRDIHEYVKYDERGLPLRALFADTLHVYYRFKKHGDPSIQDYSDW